MIELYIVHKELPPFTELGRMIKIETYFSLEEMIALTCNDEYAADRRFYFRYCKYHITLLFYEEGTMKKMRFKNYDDYKKTILKL